MADVTINNLTGQAPTNNDVFPFSTTGATPSTYKASLAQIKTALGLATVATTGSYNDLINRPTIPTAVSQLTNDSRYITITQRSVVTASGTAILFTGIPSTAKRITVMWTSLRTNGTASVILRVGTSSGIVASGYVGGTSHTGASPISSPTGILIGGASSSDTRTGTIVINNLSDNTWIGTGLGSNLDSPSALYNIVSRISLGQALDRVSVTTTNGTDQFNNGSVNIMYE